jgi:hypothetical protein
MTWRAPVRYVMYVVDDVANIRVHTSNGVPYQPMNLETGHVLGAYLR